MDIQSTEILNQLLTSPIPEVKDVAEGARELIARLQAAEINKSEFDELIDDLTNIRNIDKSMFSLQVYSKLISAINIIMVLKGLAPL